MGYDITRSDIDRWRKYVKQAVPYTDEEFNNLPYDGPEEPERDQATTALRLLKYFGLDPYDENDYGKF